MRYSFFLLKVLDGKQCLNNFQITALLVLTTKRALDLAASKAQALDNWCCDIQKVFADLALTSGNKTSLWERDLLKVIDKSSAFHWEEAEAHLKETKWCKEFKERCKHARKHILKGCDNLNELEFV